MTSLYFFEAPGKIKIGISKNLKQRAADLRRQNGADLVLFAAVPGSWHLERHIHKKLSDHRLHGEWFADNEEVRGVIKTVIKDGPAAIGFVEPMPKKAPVQAAAQPYHIMLGNLCELLWPGEALQQLSVFTEQPEGVCATWLSGDATMPALLRMAFASHLITWMLTDRK